MKSITFDFKTVKYTVNGHPDFTLSEALRLWKAKFDTFKHFKRDVIKHPALEPLGEFVENVWDEIIPVTIQEAFVLKNMEIRRTYFDCIGVIKLFKSLDPLLLDKQVINKKRTRWDEKNKAYDKEYEDVYELYKIDGNKLFEAPNDWNKPNPVFAVRCWCTTTQREYWIYVPAGPAYGRPDITWSNREPEGKPDAISAIAWTIRIGITNPKRIYRQGDIIVAEGSPSSTEVAPYHLTKAQYLSLMYSET